MSRPRSRFPKNKLTTFRLTQVEQEEMRASAENLGFKTISDYIRHLHFLAKGSESKGTESDFAQDYPASTLKPFLKTRNGKILHGNSLAYLLNAAEPKSVDLIVTSPPFGLVREKSYGNHLIDNRNNVWRRLYSLPT